MKNIHLIPTDKPSRLYKSIFDNELSFNPDNSNHFTINQNIYITNSEKIKEGDWMIRGNEQPIKVTKDFFWDFGVRYYKIILTTDITLLIDGVQAIDDEFLEWFVNNPSCEEVEVDLVSVNEFGSEVTVSSYGFDRFIYKTIIPKEEPKQYNNLNYGGGFTEEDIKRVSERKPKQETLEEDIKRYEKFRVAHDENYIVSDDIQDLKESYYYKGRRDECIKWQAERMYSEEEVKHIVSEALQSSLVTVDLEQWFKQFKKK